VENFALVVMGGMDSNPFMKLHSFLRFIALVAVGAAFLPGAQAGENRASQILTAEIAQNILGVPVEGAAKNAEADTENGKTVISFASYSAKGGEFNAPRVSLMLRKAGSSDEAKSIFLSSKTTYKGEEVTGLGDLAYRTAMPAQLNVLKGQTWLIISAGTFKAPDPALQEKAAREILKKL